MRVTPKGVREGNFGVKRPLALDFLTLTLIDVVWRSVSGIFAVQ